MSPDADLIVVGAGPAGLAAAIHAARAGRAVTLVTPREGPQDKACGEGLMPGAVALLRALCPLPSPAATLRGVRYRAAFSGQAGPWVDADFPQGPGLGVRRTILSAALWEAARAAGVRVELARATGCHQDERGVTLALAGARTPLRAPHLIAADGLGSPLRAALGLEAPPGRGQPRFGLQQHFAVAPWLDRVEVWWAEDCEAYVTPVDSGLVGVAFLFRRPTSAAALWARFPALRARLPGGEACARPRGAGPFGRRARAVTAGRVLLVGDAAGYPDPLTGEGVALGLATAKAAVEALKSDAPWRYPNAYKRATRKYFLLTRWLVMATATPAARRTLLAAARTFPAVFRLAVGALGGGPPSAAARSPSPSSISTP